VFIYFTAHHLGKLAISAPTGKEEVCDCDVFHGGSPCDIIILKRRFGQFSRSWKVVLDSRVWFDELRNRIGQLSATSVNYETNKLHRLPVAICRKSCSPWAEQRHSKHASAGSLRRGNQRAVAEARLGLNALGWRSLALVRNLRPKRTRLRILSKFLSRKELSEQGGQSTWRCWSVEDEVHGRPVDDCRNGCRNAVPRGTLGSCRDESGDEHYSESIRKGIWESLWGEPDELTEDQCKHSFERA